MQSKKFLGFTIAEILIAVAIIGIISVMVVPAVYSNHQKKAFVLNLQKVYAEFSQVMTVFLVDQFAKDLSRTYFTVKNSSPTETDIKNSAGRFLKENFTVMEDCGTTMTPCFASQYTAISGNNEGIPCNNGYSVTLKRGTAICIEPPTIDSGDFISANVYIDVNGPEDPNVGGRDVFNFNIYKDGSINFKYNPSSSDRYKNSCIESAYGGACLEKIMSDKWKMDY